MNYARYEDGVPCPSFHCGKWSHPCPVCGRSQAKGTAFVSVDDREKGGMSLRAEQAGWPPLGAIGIDWATASAKMWWEIRQKLEEDPWPGKDRWSIYDYLADKKRKGEAGEERPNLHIVWDDTIVEKPLPERVGNMRLLSYNFRTHETVFLDLEFGIEFVVKGK